jgi:ankyrin repeat protein
MAVCARISESAAELLVAAGAEKDMFAACFLGDLPRVTLLTYDNPRLVYERDVFRLETPLHKGVQNGHVEVVQFLLENQAEVSAANCFGQTPLHQAAVDGSTDVVKRLIAHSAEVNAKEEDGYTALDYAIKYCGVRSAVVQMLREHGAKQGVEIRSLYPDILEDVLSFRYGAQVGIKLSEDGDHIEAFNIYPDDELYFIKKINKSVEDPQEEALMAIKDALFPDENVRVRAVTQDEDGILDLKLELLDV